MYPCQWTRHVRVAGMLSLAVVSATYLGSRVFKVYRVMQHAKHL